MTDKKLFSSLSGLVIGVVAGAGIIAAPTAAFADHHNATRSAQARRRPILRMRRQIPRIRRLTPPIKSALARRAAQVRCKVF